MAAMASHLVAPYRDREIELNKLHMHACTAGMDK
jgi:hypothetical protein